ncbi:MAG: hypothetical protein AABY07_07145 [Nanoarchaeota archaeon]
MTTAITKERFVRLDDLLIEAESPREGSSKRLFTFDKSLESINSRGFQRHLRSYEAFRILIDAIENPNSRYKSIKEDMLFLFGEWFSLAMILNKNKLTTYIDPSNLVYKDDEYLVRGPKLEHSGEKTFTIPKGYEAGGFIPLGELPRNLVIDLYSRTASRLPEEIRSNAGLYVPREGVLGPCGRGDNFGIFDVVGGICFNGASRGVRVARVNK